MENGSAAEAISREEEEVQMKIAGIYSFNNGKEIITAKFGNEFEEICEIITEIQSQKYKTKTSREKTMHGKKLYGDC